MGQIVKGIIIPDDAYLDYGRGTGPQLVNANQDITVEIGAQETIVVNGMRFDDVHSASILQNATEESATTISLTEDGLTATLTFDTLAFEAAEATLTLRDTQAVDLVAVLDIQLVEKT